MNRTRCVMIVAGEPSGDHIGGALMAALRTLSSCPVSFCGVGGEAMSAQGLRSLFPLDETSVMGLQEVVGRIPLLLRRIRQVAAFAVRQRPDVLVIIDSPDFTHRVARRVRRMAPEIPIVNYVPPMVWVWRRGRARRMTGYVDRILSILPFEHSVFEQENGPPCIYVGHPAVEQHMIRQEGAGVRFRRAHGIAEDEKVLVVLPGSRYNEIRRIGPVFGEVVSSVAKQYDRLRPVVVAAAPVHNEVRDVVSHWPVQSPLVVHESEKLEAFDAADIALATSGTVSVELGLAGTPMVIAYSAALLTGIIWRISRKVNFVSIVNLVLNQEIVPEHLAVRLDTAAISETVLTLLTDEDDRKAALQGLATFREHMAITGLSPSQRAAHEIIGFFGKNE